MSWRDFTRWQPWAAIGLSAIFLVTFGALMLAFHSSGTVRVDEWQARHYVSAREMRARTPVLCPHAAPGATLNVSQVTMLLFARAHPPYTESVPGAIGTGLMLAMVTVGAAMLTMLFTNLSTEEQLAPRWRRLLACGAFALAFVVVWATCAAILQRNLAAVDDAEMMRDCRVLEIVERQCFNMSGRLALRHEATVECGTGLVWHGKTDGLLLPPGAPVPPVPERGAAVHALRWWHTLLLPGEHPTLVACAHLMLRTYLWLTLAAALALTVAGAREVARFFTEGARDAFWSETEMTTILDTGGARPPCSDRQ